IPDRLMSVLIKTLLVHGAQHDPKAKKALTESLKRPANANQFKEMTARFVGYGGVDIDRVLACTEQRATAIACSEIGESEIHEYRFPLPADLAGSKAWRRMIVTLAWFSPINPNHRNLREASLSLKPAKRWDDL